MTVRKRATAIALGVAMLGGLALTNSADAVERYEYDQAGGYKLINSHHGGYIGWTITKEGTGFGRDKLIRVDGPGGVGPANPVSDNGYYILGLNGSGSGAITVSSTTWYDGMSPHDLTGMAYSSAVPNNCEKTEGNFTANTSTNATIRPSFQLSIWGPNVVSGPFDQLKTTINYEPYLDPGEAGLLVHGNWRRHDGMERNAQGEFISKGWWSTQPMTRGSNSVPGGIPTSPSASFTYRDILNAMPNDWYVKSINYKVGTASSESCMYLDNMQIHVSPTAGVDSFTFDWGDFFEPVPPPVLTGAKRLGITTYDTTQDPETGTIVFEADLEWLDADGNPFVGGSKTPADADHYGDARLCSVPGECGTHHGIQVFFREQGSNRDLCAAYSDEDGHVTCIVTGSSLLPNIFGGSTTTFEAWNWNTEFWHSARDEAQINRPGLL